MSHQPDNIFAGTQVVALVEIRGPNKSLVHPRGAVGVVTRTPTGAEGHFLVRFPDGFEKSLTRAQLEVLKHFKDRLGEAGCVSPSAPPTAFDLESLIIYRCVTGSQAYGLETEESDTDRRGIYLAPAELQWFLFGAPEQFEDNTAQACYWELQKFLIMALRANPNILECLYSPLVEKATPLAEELLSIRQGFLSQMIFQTFNGYALSQFKKIEQDVRNQPSREVQQRARSAVDEGGLARYAGSASHLCEGIRWKLAMHLLCLLITGAATLPEARVPAGVETHCERLLTVKFDELPLPQRDAWRPELYRLFEYALAGTKLIACPHFEVANELLLQAREE